MLRKLCTKDTVFKVTVCLSAIVPMSSGLVAFKAFGAPEAIVPLCMFIGPFVGLGISMFVWSIVDLRYHPAWKPGYPVGPIWNPRSE